MSKRDFQARQKTIKQTYFDIGEEIGIQKMWDYMQIVLTNPEVMSTHVVPKDRLLKIYKELSEVAAYYATAFTDHVEADKYQDELDKVLQPIWGDEFQKFNERYPYIQEQKYDKGKAKWR